jgi:peptidoglycan/xylan/chitin deacetylase (PgdA/CDA1 family)
MRWTCRRRSSSQGHTVKSFPADCEAILGAGHEIAHRSYAHVDPSRQSPDEERADLQRALAALDRLSVRPLGYRSPSADMSPATLPLLEEHEFLYDSGLMGDDFRPYRPRIGGARASSGPHAPAGGCFAWNWEASTSLVGSCAVRREQRRVVG